MRRKTMMLNTRPALPDYRAVVRAVPRRLFRNCQESFRAMWRDAVERGGCLPQDAVKGWLHGLMVVAATMVEHECANGATALHFCNSMVQLAATAALASLATKCGLPLDEAIIRRATGAARDAFVEAVSDRLPAEFVKGLLASAGTFQVVDEDGNNVEMTEEEILAELERGKGKTN